MKQVGHKGRGHEANQAKWKKQMKNTLEMGKEKQTRGKFTDLAHSFGRIHRERKGKQGRRIEK